MVPGMADVSEIGDRIREVRLAHDLSQSGFAKKLGKTTRGAVGNWERGKGVKRENLIAISEVFTVSLEWLATGKVAPRGGDKNLNEPANAFVGDRLPKGAHKIPLYGQAVGGEHGEFVLNGNRLDDIVAPPTLSGTDGAYAVTVAGDSMEPRYEDGETVYVDPNRRCVRGSYVVAQVQLEESGPILAYIKRLVRRTDAELVLEQLNPPKELRFPGNSVVSVHYIVMGGRV